MNRLASQIKNRFLNLNINPRLTFSNIPNNLSQSLTHAYHRYPAKFIPTLAEYLINIHSKPHDLVCDPFGGCGTTLIEAKINKRDSIGIDINPLANLISKTKITPINPNTLNREKLDLFERIKIAEKNSFYSSHQFDPKIYYWFEEGIIRQLIPISDSINKTKNIIVKRFFMCAFSHILKNCSRWLMKSIKPTIDKDKQSPDPIKIFNYHLNFMMKKNYEFYQLISQKKLTNVKAKFYLRDARNTKLKSSSIDYILTSPPYVTSYEYADLHQLSILWFKMTKDLLNFKRKFIGTSYKVERHIDTNSEIADEIIDKLITNSHDINLTKNVKAYYEDMWNFILEAKRILKKNRKISLVLGNTIMKNVRILNAEVAYEQLLKAGFKQLSVEKRLTSAKSITPYRDIISGRFTSIKNQNKRRAYEHEYILTAVN